MRKRIFSIPVILCIFLTQHIFCSSETRAVIEALDKSGKHTYQYNVHGSRPTYVDLHDEETAKRLEIVTDVLSDADIDQAEKNYEPPQQKAKILVPFMACVALPVITMWSRGSFDLPQEVLRTSLVAFIGYEIADIRSFWTHIIADHVDVNNKDYPILFKYIPVFFQDHHLRSNEINKASYWYTARLFYMLDLPVVATAAVMALTGYETSAAILALSSLAFAQNQIIHGYAHGKKFTNKFLHAFMSFCQSTGIIISKKFHAAHHADKKHSVNYSAISGHTELFFQRFFPKVIPYIEVRCQGILERTAKSVKSLALTFFSESSSFVHIVWG